MAIERKVFRGIGAVIAAVESDQVFEIAPKVLWKPPTDFSASKRIRIDLDKSPSKAAWSDVEVDDRGVGADGDFLGTAMCPTQLIGFHVTSLGGYRGKGEPPDLKRSPFVGAVYLEDAFFDRHRAKIDPPGDPWPTQGFLPCQMTTVAYSDSADNGDRRSRRYAGFLGQMTTRAGSRVTVKLRDLGGEYTQPYDFDLSSADHCDPDPPLTAADKALLRPDSPLDEDRALFVELRYATQLGLDSSKLPIGLGQ